ncbi:ParB/RepB/Spo0J family partition protein [Marinivivus vitaminiproducens]|uniref:ParB/RepB/Spo0J family partition protein n=1 Tax=Marinivivus vitaminiproducens TaxID=3035935 RepID=UPI0027A31B59|nr:ParB/RepB/Spo0J family partition protein [Geminicoccaceae bacterium SCSIO 64248]
MSQREKRLALQAAVEQLGNGPEARPTTIGRGIAETAFGLHRDGLQDEISRLEDQLAAARSSGERLSELDPTHVDDRLPVDRHPRAMSEASFDRLRESIATLGQDTPIVVRRSPDGSGRFELAAGRRRLEACRQLGRPVLARVRDLDDEAMLAIRFRENAEREDLSVYERGRWLVEVADRSKISGNRLAAMLGISQPAIVDYFKLGRLPAELVEALDDPRHLTIGDARGLDRILRDDPTSLKELLNGLAEMSGASTRRQIAHATRAYQAGTKVLEEALAPRVIADERGRKLGVLTRSGRQWVCRWAPDVEDDAIDYVTDQLPKLIADWRKERA